MGRNDRKPVSRIKLENLPRTCEMEAKKVGPLGFLRIESTPDSGLLLYLGPLGPFALPGRWSCVKV